MKKDIFLCTIFCIALTAYPQGLLQADGNEAVQSDTVTQETTIAAEALSEISPAKIAEVQGAMAEIRIDELIKDGLFKNKALINQQALLLPEGRRLNIQEQYKLGYVKPLLFNSLFGFGIGNFINKDRAGGITHVVIDSLAASTVVVAGCIYLGDALLHVLALPILLFGTDDDKQLSDLLSSINKRMEICKIIVQTGLGVLLANRLASIISVSVHTAKYNRTLKEALTPAKAEVSIQAVPIIVPNQFGLALSINY